MKIIAVVSGGFTGEKVISEKSAAMVMDNIDRSIFKPYLVWIDKKEWNVRIGEQKIPINRHDFSFEWGGKAVFFDAVFMAIHGDPGENGRLQAYFEMLDLPVTTGGFFTMALTFNKFATTSMLKKASFSVAPAILLRKGQPFSPKEILSELGLPLFVKPNAGGSSLGVTKVQSEDEMREAIETAFNEGEEVMLESFLEGPEYTCGVLERKGEVVPLAVTEIRSKNEYFDFQAKYTPEFVEEITPAPLDEKRYKQCQELAVSVFKYLNCNVLARVDFILTKNGFQIIEINTVPGLTEVSIVPQMAEHEGISKTELISIMLENVL